MLKPVLVTASDVPLGVVIEPVGSSAPETTASSCIILLPTTPIRPPPTNTSVVRSLSEAELLSESCCESWLTATLVLTVRKTSRSSSPTTSKS